MTEKEYLASLSEKNNTQKESQNDQNESSNFIKNQNQSTNQDDLYYSALASHHISGKEENNSDTLDYNQKEELQGFPTPETLAESIKGSEAPENIEKPEPSEKNEEPQTQSENHENDDKTLDEEANLPATKNSELAENPKKKKKKSKNKEEKKEKEGPMTLLDHLKELRVRLTRIVIIIFVGFFACYSIAEPAYTFLTIPLTENMPEGSTLMYTSPPGAFFVYLKISLLLSFFISSPFTFYQVWAFVAPGLYKEEKKMLIPLSLSSAFFFIGGATFCYYFVFPIAFKFFMGFATTEIIPMISIEEYLSFVLKLLIAFGLVFEMPLFSFFLARMGLLTAQRMRKWRKYAVLAIFIIAALLTPPDIFSQVLMAGPMIFLYEFSILITIFVAKQKKKEKEFFKSSEEAMASKEDE